MKTKCRKPKTRKAPTPYQVVLDAWESGNWDEFIAFIDLIEREFAMLKDLDLLRSKQVALAGHRENKLKAHLAQVLAVLKQCDYALSVSTTPLREDRLSVLEARKEVKRIMVINKTLFGS